MKKHLLIFLMLSSSFLFSQNINFEEYDLDNGLHVILHIDNTAPVVAISVSYNVGIADEDSITYGASSLFNRLLYNTKNIGKNNLDNSNLIYLDKNYYSNTYSSNKYEKGLWLESERMTHLVIDTLKIRMDSTVNLYIQKKDTNKLDFKKNAINYLLNKDILNNFENDSLRYYNSFEAEHFIEFYNTYYTPSNAVLTISGDINSESAKSKIEHYFGDLKKSYSKKKNKYNKNKYKPINTIDTVFCDDINSPAVQIIFNVSGIKKSELKTIVLIEELLNGSMHSRIYEDIIAKEKLATEINSVFLYSKEKSAIYFTASLHRTNINKSIEDLSKSIIHEVEKLQNIKVFSNEYETLLNKIELDYINKNRNIENIAETLSNKYVIFNNTHLINKDISDFRKISKQDIKNVASKYFNEIKIIYYLPSE